MAEEIAAEAMDDTVEPLTTQPVGLAIIFDDATWGGSGGETIRQQVLRRAIKEIEAPDTAPSDCARRYPFADTIFLRHPGLFPGVPDADRDRFIAAEIARSTSVVFNILSSLSSEEAEPLTRYRALLEMLNRGQRAPEGLAEGELEALLDSAWEALPAAAALLPTAVVAPEADLHFVAARLCMMDGRSAAECIQHLDFALSADPWFSAARQMRIELLDTLIRRVSWADAGNCDRLQSLLLIDIDNMLEGLEDPRGRVDLGLSLDAAAQPNNLILLLGAAYAMREGGARRLAEAAFAEVAAALETDHPCNALLQEALDGLK